VVQRILTDNAFASRNSIAFRTAVREGGAVQRFIRPHRPQTNGKVERFIRTLLEEWAYVRPYTSNQERVHALTPWLHTLQPSPSPHHLRCRPALVSSSARSMPGSIGGAGDDITRDARGLSLVEAVVDVICRSGPVRVASITICDVNGNDNGFSSCAWTVYPPGALAFTRVS
jgi:hypothetical protein